MNAITPHDALIYVMITMSASDRKVADSELHRIGQIVKTFPVFMGYDLEGLSKAAEACGEYFADDEGLEKLLDSVAATLPKKLRETAYALAVEIAAADLRVRDEEIRLLEMIRDALTLDKLVTAAIERAARARYQTL